MRSQTLTGAGKSTLLRNLILQDIEAGRGVALIDPHGDLATEILEQIPPERTNDVVYFDPAGRDPLAINLFRATGDDWHLVASGIVSAFKKIWASSWGTRLEYILYATLAALLQCDNTSLLGVSRMLFDDKYRAWVVRQVKDPMVRSFWVNEFANYDRGFRQEAVSPIQNKVGQLFLAPALRNALGQIGSKVSFRFIMDEQRIFIANLSKGLIGEAHSSLLGSLLITGFEVAALSRADTPPHERRDFFLYADEFHHYATDSFASILSEARKYRLSLTLAHQYLEAKAYRCHHCGELIFLTEDESELNYAHSVNAPTEAPEIDQHSERLKKLRANKEVKEAQLSLAQVDAELSRLRKAIKPQMPKKTSARDILKEELDAEVEWDVAENELRAAIEEQYKDNPKLKAQLKRALKRKVLDGLPDR